MQKQKYNCKPVKALTVLFMAGLFLVLLPKFGTEAKAATEITSDITSWSGEMQLTSGDVTINGNVSLTSGVTLTINEGLKLTVNGFVGIDLTGAFGGISWMGGFGEDPITKPVFTFNGQGTLEIKAPSSVNPAVTVDVIQNSGTMIIYGGNASGNGKGGAGLAGSVTINGGNMTIVGGNANASGSGDGGTGVDYPGMNNNAIAILNGGMMTVAGGGKGSGGIHGGHGFQTPVTLNGGKLLITVKSNGDVINNSVAIDSNLHYSIGGEGDYTNANVNNAKGGSNGKLWAPIYAVNITEGIGMTKTIDSGAASQTRVIGEMIDVVYTSDGAFFFPEGYSVSPLNGVSVTRNSYSQITVSGTPTADTSITLPAATMKTQSNVPYTVNTTNCTTTDNNDGKITGVTTAMEYRKDDATNWTTGTGSDITGLVPGTYYVRVKATDSTYESDEVTLWIKGVPTISAEDITVTYGDTDKSMSGTVIGSIAGGDMSYAVKSGSEDYIDVHATTGALTIKKVPADGMAYVVVTTAENATATQGTKEVTVTINKATPVVTAPTAKTLTASGSALELVDAGSTTGGTLQYAVGIDATTVPTSGWDIEIPSKAEAGTYYVWYRVEGDQNWADADSFEPVKVVIKEQASNTTTDSDPTQSNTGTTTDPAPAPVTPVYTPEPVVEKANEVPEPSIFTRKNKDGSETKIEIIWNADGTTTVINETKQADGTTVVKEETRDAKGNGTIKIEKKDADGNLLSSTEGTIKVNKKGTETIKSTTKNADGSVSEKTQKTYKRDPNADNIKKVTVTEKKTDAEGNTETIKATALVGVLGDATISEKSTYNGAGAEGKTAITVKEERQYSLSVNGRLKLTSLSTDGEKLTIPESIELDGMKRVVKAIGKNAMKGNKTVKEVVLGENITTICTSAFRNCKNLELIELTGSVKKIYKNAFKGIAENAKFVIKASEEDFERIVELLKKSGVSDTVTFERVEA